MRYKIRINGKHYKENCMPGLNDMLHEQGRSPMAYNRLKHTMETVAICNIRNQMRDKNGKPVKITKPCVLNYKFGEKRKGQRRDYDNIVAGGRKIITDALVRNGTIKDDSPKYIVEYGNNEFEYVDVPYVEVEIVEIE